MDILLLYILAVVSASTRSIFTKKGGDLGGGALFNLVRASSAFVLFLILALISGSGTHVPTLWYGIVYGVFFFGSCYCGLKALELGPLSITSSLVSFALVIPCIYGAIWQNEYISLLDIAGFALIGVAVVTLKYRGKPKGDNVKFKRGWIFYLTATILCDGGHSIVKVMHQKSYPGLYMYEFICTGMLIGALLFTILLLSNRSEPRSASMPERRKNIFYGGAAGVANGMYHFFVLYLSSKENATALFPIVSVSTMAASILLGRLLFKEKLSRTQLAGVIIAMCAVLLIKI